MRSRASAEAVRKPRALQFERLEAKNLELMRTLQILEEARANLADQYDFAPIGFITLDDRGCIREINLTAARMLDRERSQLLTMPFFTHVAKPSFKVFLNHLRECRLRQREVVSELALQTRTHQLVHVELRSVPVLDPRRGGIVYRTAVSDVTERLRADLALRESEERYRDLVELSPDGIFIQNEGGIVFANNAALRLCGVENAKDLIGRQIIDWVRPAFRKSLIAILPGQAPDARSMPTVESQFLRSNGTTVDVEVAARSFRHAGEPAMLVVARDVTRRKTAERNVLAISEREKTNFGRDLHDSLCQNLMGAACLAEALRNQMRKVSAVAAAEAEDIAHLLRQCVDEARSLARGLCPVAIEKSGLVAALHELTAEVTGRTRIGCSLECDDLLIVEDVTVATNLYRIAQEAVTNAVKHGNARRVLIQLAANNGKMTLRVRDDGKGFPAKPKQTGMGLHTMHYRASMIGGLLDVRRDGPRGTVVTCSFPSRREAQ